MRDRDAVSSSAPNVLADPHDVFIDQHLLRKSALSSFVAGACCNEF